MYWEYDHALYLYPLPEALVLADDAGAGSHQFDTCSCLNPVRVQARGQSDEWGRGGAGRGRALPAQQAVLDQQHGPN